MKAFTLIEVMICAAILAILAVLIAPELLSGKNESQALQCGTNLKLIEGAKDSWNRDNPGTAPTEANLLKILGVSEMPKCASGGVYAHVLEVGTITSCSLNGSSFEKTVPNYDNTANGYHDSAK